MKSRIWILELEDTGLTWSCFEQVPRGLRLVACSRQDLDGLEPALLFAALEQARIELGFSGGPVNVVLGDRRFAHFDLRCPRLDGAELRQLAAREARRRGSFSPDVEIISSLRLIGREAGLYRFGVVALPKSAWDAVAAVLARARIQVASMTSLEDAMTGALPADAARDAALLELGADRVRFVSAHDRRVGQVRRFLLPAGSAAASDPTFVATQLALEVPRTQEFFVDQGQAPPQTLIVSHLLRFDEEHVAMIGGFADVRLFEPPVDGLQGEMLPGMAAFGVLTRIRRREVHNILGKREIRYPLTPRARAFAAAVVLVTAGLCYGAWQLRSERLKIEDQRDAASRRVAELRRTESAISAKAEPAVVDQDERVREILERRRPISLLFEKFCELTPRAIRLAELRFAHGSRIEVRGNVDHADRIAALDELSKFASTLQGLAFLKPRSQHLVPAGEGQGLGFRLLFDWSSP